MEATTPLAPIANKESFIQRFGDWIEGLFHVAENDFAKLDDEAKKAAVWGSGIIAVINANLSSVPSVVISIIQAKFPEVHLDILQGFLNQLQQKFDAVAATTVTLEDAVKWAQEWLSTHKASNDNAWAAISSAAANVLSILFSPETAVEKFISIGVYVYHMIVKPHVAA